MHYLSGFKQLLICIVADGIFSKHILEHLIFCIICVESTQC